MKVLISNPANGGCLRGGLTAAAIPLVPCHSAATTQRWTMLTNGSSGKVTVNEGTMCLTGYGDGAANYPVGTWTCALGGIGQQIALTAAGELKLGSGTCIAVRPLGLYAEVCTGSATQKWTVTAWTGVTPTPSSLSPATVASLEGPLPSVASIEARGGVWATYESKFRTWAENHWTADGSNWGSAYFYDRAKIFYVWWARTGNAAYLSRAHALVADFRTRYIEGGGYRPDAHYADMEGIALHYLLTGDERSLLAVGRVADMFYEPGYQDQLGDTTGIGDPRVQARALTSIILARQLKAPSLWGTDWTVAARSTVNQILRTQSADGAYRWWVTCYKNEPWIDGLLNQALIDYYTFVEADPRVATMVRRNVDYLWTNNWIPASRAMTYMDGACTWGPNTGSGPGPAPEANMLVLSGFGFTYRTTGDPKYITQGDQVLTGGVNGSWYNGSKHFNQIHMSSYQYFQYRF